MRSSIGAEVNRWVIVHLVPFGASTSYAYLNHISFLNNTHNETYNKFLYILHIVYFLKFIFFCYHIVYFLEFILLLLFIAFVYQMRMYDGEICGS